MALDKGATYNAAVDVNDNLLPPEDIVENNGPVTSELIKVKCVLAARLVAVDEGITVTPPGDGDWVYRAFSPSGVVEWAWAVTATTPETHQLRLDLRPAVRIEGLPSAATETLVSSFTTDVTVDATRIEAASYWFSTDWDRFAKIVAILAGALAAVLAFGRQLWGKERFDAAIGRWASVLRTRWSSTRSKPGAPDGDAS